MEDLSGDEAPVLNPSGVWPKGLTNKRKKDQMEKKKKRAPKGQVSSKKTKPPRNGSPSQTSLHTSHNLSIVHPSVALMSANSNNQFPTMRLSTTNVHAQYPLFNQNSSAINFAANHLSSQVPQISQDSSLCGFEHQPNRD